MGNLYRHNDNDHKSSEHGIENWHFETSPM